MVTAILFVVAVLLAFGAVGSALIISRSAKLWAGRMFQALMWMLVLASAGGIILTGRTLRVGEMGLQVESGMGIGSTLSAKLLLALAIGLAVALCLAFATRAWWRQEPTDRFAARGLAQPLDVFTALLAFYLAFSLVPLAFAPAYYFHASLIYPFFIFCALILWLRYSTVDPVVVVKQTLGVLVLGSLVAAVVLPTLALQPGYTGLIPGFNQRLWGVTASANTLGSAALALFLIEVCEPTRRRWLHVVLLFSALAAMVLSQSKAALVIGLVCAALLGTWRWFLATRASAAGRAGRGALLAMAGLCLLGCVSVGLLWFLLADPRILGDFARKLESRAVADLATGTGRVDIWWFAFKSGLESPIFGHGADFWGPEMRLRTGMTGATHAHNQFLQVFSRSGVIGLLAYIWLLGLLAVYALRASGPTRGGSLAFLSAFFIRSFVEVPLQPNSVLGAEFFAFMMLFVYLIDRARRQLPTSSNVGYLGADVDVPRSA